MLADAALKSIADNLASLNLDPVLHLKIVARSWEALKRIFLALVNRSGRTALGF